MWRIDTGKLARTIPTGHRGPVTALTWRPDGQAVAAAGTDNTVRIWDAQTGEPRGPALTGPTNAIWGLSFSPDGRHLAALVPDSDPWLWDNSASPPRGTALHGEGESVTTASFSADGRRLITVAPTHFASADDTVPQTGNVFEAPDMTPSAVRVWDTDTGELAGPPLTGRGGHMTDLMDLAENDRDQPIFAAAISPDGQRMLVSTVNGLRLHDVATGQPVGEPWITETPRAIAGVVFSPDGNYVVSADTRTSQLQLWDVKTGRPVGNGMIGHTGAVLSVAFTADGNHIVSRGADDGWMLWPGPNSWRDELFAKLTSNMTRAEWHDWVSPTIEYQKACPSLDVPE